ncbi:putative calcium-dependent lipid-binding transcriptional regulator, plant [Helianthus anomalus]
MGEQTTEQTVAAATIVIRESIKPRLKEYHPSGISSLKFSKLLLGDVAPKIEGI